MLVPMSDVINGITNYFRSDVLPNLPTDGIKGFGVGFAAALAVNRIERIIRQLAELPIVAMLGVVDDQEMVDVDAMREAALQAIRRKGWASKSVLSTKSPSVRTMYINCTN